MSFAIAATAFLLIFPVELPDKTFIATLVLATRYRPVLVWVGVTAAFLVQTVVAVTLGGLIGRLPRTPVEIFAGLMFLVGRSSRPKPNPASPDGGRSEPVSWCSSWPSGGTCHSC